MKSIIKARIYLRDMHATQQLESVRSLHIKDIQNNNGNAWLFDDELEPNASFKLFEAHSVQLILLPVSGAIHFKSANKEKLIAAGQSLIVPLTDGERYTLTNPFSNEYVNVVRIYIKTEQPFPSIIGAADISASRNSLITFFNIPLRPRLSIGLFDGRAEDQIIMSANETCFIYVLRGAFEVEGRLLHERDGLFISTTSPIELEALSDNAVLLSLAQ